MITSIKCSICFLAFFPPLPLPLSLIVGTISAKNNKSNRTMGCSREVVGGTHSTKCSSQCKLPIRDRDRRSPHSWAMWVSWLSALWAQIINVRCYPTKKKYIFCSHLWAPRTFHRSRLSLYSISSSLSILLWMNCWCSAERGMDAGQKVSYKKISKPLLSPSPLLTFSAFSAQDVNLHGLLSTASRRLE